MEAVRNACVKKSKLRFLLTEGNTCPEVSIQIG